MEAVSRRLSLTAMTTTIARMTLAMLTLATAAMSNLYAVMVCFALWTPAMLRLDACLHLLYVTTTIFAPTTLVFLPLEIASIFQCLALTAIYALSTPAQMATVSTQKWTAMTTTLALLIIAKQAHASTMPLPTALHVETSPAATPMPATHKSAQTGPVPNHL